MAIGIMIPQFSTLANTTFLGNFKSSNSLVSAEDVLGVAGVAGIYYLVFALITYGLSTGLLMLMSRRAGKNDYQGVGRYFFSGLALGFLLALILGLLCWLFHDYFFSVALHNAQIEGLASDFINWRVWGLPFLACGFLSNMFFVCINKTKFMIWSSCIQALVNIVFDYLFIFGHGSFQDMGIVGAAKTSVLAEVSLFAINMLIIFSLPQLKKYRMAIAKAIQWETMGEIFVKSSPLMIQVFISIGAWEVFFIFVEHLGKTELASSQVLRSLYGIMGIAIWALAHTSNSMVSNLIGQKRHKDVIPLLKKTLTISLSYTGLVCLIIYFLRFQIFGMYTENIEVRDMALETLPIILFSGLLFCISTVCFNTVLGFGETRRNLWYEMITIGIYLIYILIVIEKLRLPLWAAWTSEFLYWTVLLVLSLSFILSKKWVKE